MDCLIFCRNFGVKRVRGRELQSNESADGEAGEQVDPSSLCASAPWTGSGLQVVTSHLEEDDVFGAPQAELLWVADNCFSLALKKGSCVQIGLWQFLGTTHHWRHIRCKTGCRQPAPEHIDRISDSPLVSGSPFPILRTEKGPAEVEAGEPGPWSS